MYGIIAGNVTKKELDLQKVISETFTQRKLSQIIDLVISSKLSLINAKEIAYRIIDGEQRDPLAIAEAENLVELKSDASSNSFDLIIDEVLSANKTTVDKIKESGKDGPVMFLVGQVMKKINKKGDPQEIQKLIKAKLGLK
jgi:Asp-tRNA(Asn)/Glu-tRNA(Gln) amidotransferase B subunit